MRLLYPSPAKARWALAAAVIFIGAASSARADSTTDRLLEAGPFGSGLASFALEDGARRTPPNGEFPGSASRELPTMIWYPAASPDADEQLGAEAAQDPRGFPLIVFGHGIGLTGGEGSFVASFLATHGYVVAAPDFPLSKSTAPGGVTSADIPGQAEDVLFLIDRLRARDFQGEFPVAASIDFDRIGVLGYSLGGATVALAGSDPSIDAVATLAPATCPLRALGGEIRLEKPLLILQGTSDLVVKPGLNSEILFERSGTPKQLVLIDNGSHGFFTNAPTLDAASPDSGVDTLICAVFLQTVSSDATVDQCMPCSPPAVGPQLPVTRQLDLTRAGVLAFFEGNLRCSAGALEFLARQYAPENSELVSRFAGDVQESQRLCEEN